MSDIGLTPFALAKQWIPQLFAELVKIRQHREAEINFLGETFGDPYELSKYYVEPNCQNLNPVDHGEDYGVVKQPMFQLVEDFIGESRRNNHMFILSDAGMGKTSLLLMLKLAHLTSFWPPSYECVLLKLGEETLKDIEAVPNKNKTVLLLDALDEDPLAWKRARDRTIELLRASQQFKRVIITCRTQFFTANGDPFNRRGQVEVGGFICLAIYCSLFSDSQVQTYLRRRFPEKIEDAEWRQRIQSILDAMGFLRMRPMLLSHIEDILESTQTIWNEYTILRALIDAWLLREQRKAKDAPADLRLKLKRVCQKVAYDMFMSRRRYITKTTEDLLRYELGEAVGYEGFSIGSRSLLNKDSDGNYRFSHSIVQEILAVEYLIGASRSGKIKAPVTDDMNRIAAAWVRQATPPVLSGRDLSIFDFSDQDFAGVNLAGANLTSAKLAGAKLLDCHLFGTTMTGADLRGADLSRSDLSGANLQGAQLTGAKLLQAVCISTDFEGAAIDGSVCDGADFSHANFARADISHSSFRQAGFRGAHCFFAASNGADFAGADFTDAKLGPDFVERVGRPEFEMYKDNKVQSSDG